MKKSIGIIGLVCILLVGCNTEPTTKQKNEDELGKPEQVTTESKINENEETENSEITKDEENASTKSNREEFLRKLTEIEHSLSEFDQAIENGTTVELKQIQGEIFVRWDHVLNEIYQALEEQLSQNDMDKLREEQREWIKYRDDTAKEAASKYEGGTMESLEYISVQAQLTKERCYELVERYME